MQLGEHGDRQFALVYDLINVENEAKLRLKSKYNNTEENESRKIIVNTVIRVTVLRKQTMLQTLVWTMLLRNIGAQLLR